MEEKFVVSSTKNPKIVMEVTPGHFTTNVSHVSHYLDLGPLKHNIFAARDIARELAAQYISCELIDTIICMEGTEIIGAYLAEELVQEGTLIMNEDSNIYVISPMNNINGQLVFQKNEQHLIENKNIILLVSSVSSGKTVHRALECLSYYEGRLVGISALFAATPHIYDYDVNAIFTEEDIPDYYYSRVEECIMCHDGIKLDAIINNEGYNEL